MLVYQLMKKRRESSLADYSGDSEEEDVTRTSKLAISYVEDAVDFPGLDQSPMRRWVADELEELPEYRRPPTLPRSFA